MERVANVAHGFDEARRYDLEQSWRMTSVERHRCARILRDRYYGTDGPDVRESGVAEVHSQVAAAGR